MTRSKVDVFIDTLSPEAQALRHDRGFRAFVRQAISDPENCRADCAGFFPDAPRLYVLTEIRPSMESSREYQRGCAVTTISEMDVRRFEKKVNSSGGENACWPWLGSTDWRYGTFYHNNRCNKAHRIAWSIHHGKPVPKNLMVCHSCDNTVCVNPKHLFIGTMKDNALDSMRKGRGGNMKLTAEGVREIRRSTLTAAELARRYGVRKREIYAVRSGSTWQYVTEEP